MRKTAASIEGLGLLAGALIGGGLSHYGKIDQDAVTSMVAGAGIGYKLGWLAETGASRYRSRKFQKSLGKTPTIELKDVNKLLKIYDDMNIPIYLQTKGRSMNNAFYLPIGGKSFIQNKAYGFKQVNPRVDPESVKDAIVIGKNQLTSDTLAHELGHAEDHREHDSSLYTYSVPIAYAVSLLATASIPGAIYLQRKGKLSAGTANKVLLSAPLVSMGTIIIGKELTRLKERIASRKAMEALSGMLKKQQLEQANKRLVDAYSIYDPIRFTDVDFT